MAEWTGEKVDKSLINNGQQYVDGDGLSAEDVNAIVNNSLYASEKAAVSTLKIYRIGSIYMSVNSTSPASLFGGTWEQLKDRFLIGAGNSYAVNSTGGEVTHTLTVEEIPKHYHQNRLSGDTASSSDMGSVINGHSIWSTYGNGGDTAETGGSQPHNNMPPYLAVYMWKRIA